MLKIADGVDGAVKLALRLQLAADFNSKFAEGMRRSRINVKKSRQNYDC